MNARLKLNASFIQGSLLVAGLMGWLSHSWLVFLIVAAVLIGSSLHSGDIRSQPTKRIRTMRRRPIK